MFTIAIEAEFDDAKGLEGAEPASPQDPSTALFEALTEWWVRYAADPYEELDTQHKLKPITIPWRFLGQETALEVTFDINLLENLLEIYAAFGWYAIERIESILKALPVAFDQTKTFFRVTRNVVAVMVAQGLVELEQQTIAYARQKWVASRKTILEYLKHFKITELNTRHYSLANRKLADELLALCQEYGLEAANARRLQQNIDERNRKNPPKSRVKGSGFEQWFEVFARPQRKALNNMADSLKRIVQKFPAAILVINELPDLVLSASTNYHRVLAATELENVLGAKLDFLRDGLQTLEDSLKMPGTTTALAKLLKPMIAEPRDYSGLAALQVPIGGFEKQVLDIVFERKKKEDQSLVADLELLLSYYDDPEGVDPGSWTQVVLYHYCIRLEDTIDIKKQNDAWWEEKWGWVRRITALLALVGLLAFLPSVGVAVSVPLASLLVLCGTASVILGVLTLVHDLCKTLEAANELEMDARDKFFRLAQQNPDAIIEISECLSRSKALRDGLATGGVVSLLTMAAGRVLRPIAIALDFQGYSQDIETLFATAETDG